VIEVDCSCGVSVGRSESEWASSGGVERGFVDGLESGLEDTLERALGGERGALLGGVLEGAEDALLEGELVGREDAFLEGVLERKFVGGLAGGLKRGGLESCRLAGGELGWRLVSWLESEWGGRIVVVLEGWLEDGGG
jgi:hypothetical protein